MALDTSVEAFFEILSELVEVTSGQLSALQLNLSTFCEQEAHVRDPVLPFALCVESLDLHACLDDVAEYRDIGYLIIRGVYIGMLSFFKCPS